MPQTESTSHRNASHVACHSRRGFTLVEVLVAATLGALLLVAVASTAVGLSHSVAQLESENISSIDNVLSRIARQVRYAWWVEVPEPTVLAIADEKNRVTEYFVVGNSLLVHLPDGTQGAVLTGLEGVRFTAEKTPRLREAPSRVRAATIDSVASPPTQAQAIELKPGSELAMAFRASSDGGESSVSGRRENATEFSPTRMEVKIAQGGFSGTLTASIYPARAPRDARPRPGAPALVSVSVPILALPVAPTKEDGAVAMSSPTPPGTFDTSRVLSEDFDAPLTTVPLSISGLSAPLQSGVAYTIVLSVSGVGSLSLLAANSDPNGSRSDFMMRTSPTDTFQPMTYAVPFVLSGERTVTGTSETMVVRQVSISLDPDDGDAHVSSAGVYGQIMAEDPWLGVIRFETH